MYSIIFGNTTSYLQHLFSHQIFSNSRIERLKKFANVHCVPKLLKQRMLKYYTLHASIHIHAEAGTPFTPIHSVLMFTLLSAPSLLMKTGSVISSVF